MQNVAQKLNEYYNEKTYGKTVSKQELDQTYVGNLSTIWNLHLTY